jgi:ABC-type phosphate/phosphonate transport system substrate-binding protein
MIVTALTASLPMYDWPEFRHHTDKFWQGLAHHACVSAKFDRTTHFMEAWRLPNLAFSQTCGYPFTHEFRDLLNYVATPHYAADGCVGPNYCSVIFARKSGPLESFRGATPVINSADSMSGMLALKLVFAPLAIDGHFFKPARVSGGHLLSLQQLREGKADICAIDSVCVALAKKYRPQDLEGLVEVAHSPQVPGLPFVTHMPDVEKWRTALRMAFADPDLAEARAGLLLKDFSVLGEGAYQVILDLEEASPNLTL